jgi:Helix-turn-helix domain
MTGRELPFVVVWRKAILASGLPAPARHVAHVLAEHANADGGSCYPSIARLADETGHAESTVRAALASLEGAGYVDVTRTRGGRRAGDRLGLRNAYRLTKPSGSRRVSTRRVRGETLRQPSSNPPTAVVKPPDSRRGGSPTTGPTTGPPERAPSATRAEAAIPPAKGERKPRSRDVIFDALVEACGLTYAEMTERERKACGVAAAQLRGLEAPPDHDEVVRRAERWPAVFGEATCTPNALASHWAQLGAVRAADRRDAHDLAALRNALHLVGDEGGPA